MGLGALRVSKRRQAWFQVCWAVAVLVALEARRGSAGLADLHILPHEQLHKGRGIAENSDSSRTSLRVDKFGPQSTLHANGVLNINALNDDGQSTSGPPPRSGRLDIVLSHFDPARVQSALDFWLPFLESKKVQEQQPYVWLYCQNENMTLMDDLAPLLKYGGQIVHLENIGRESHAFLQHITGHYDDLAKYTIFSQDIPEAILRDRFEKMFEEDVTGFLPLSLVAHVDCKDAWLPPGEIPQIYSLLTRSFCPPEGYTAAYQGQFLVSRTRIKDQSWWVYKTLLDMLAAPLDHWIHTVHDNDYYKDRSNPFFGHILERSWSLAFNCFESWRHGNCAWCDHEMQMQNCGTDACQCLDRR